MTEAVTNHTAFPQVPRDELQLLWIHDYVDGVLSGILRHEGRLCFYDVCELAEDDARGDRYVIRELTDAQVLEEENWHALFREHVGTHFDDDVSDPSAKPMSAWVGFYGPYHKVDRTNYRTRPIVGWFEM